MAEPSSESRIVDPIEIDFTVDRIMETPPFPRWAGSTHSGEELRDEVEGLHGVVESALSTRGMFRAIPIDESGIAGFDPPERLTESDWIVPGVLTIGDGVKDSDSVSGLLPTLVADAMENVALQLARISLLTEIKEWASENGYNTTRVFPPGTRGDGWDIENRGFMFERLETEKIDVFLRNSRVTEPRKTFTFAIGLGANIEQADLLLSCGDCEYVTTCPYVGSMVE
ncbi:MAG: hypothetical protein U5K70_00885 [Halodesulfurarchaeum sp.]|nr:hypothetical protein [Halodesulfurarchaeum sp.]